MDTNTVILVALLALIAVGAFVVYRRRVKMKFKVPGVEMSLEGGNDATSGKITQPTRSRAGIFGNWSIGKTHMEVKGPGTIADNRSVGDTELRIDATPSFPSVDKPHSKKK